MVTGNGMMAHAFAAFAGDPSTVIFASGVSNSLETRPDAFDRERRLLERTRAAHPDALLVYFGTCSVDDPDRRATPYVEHKLAMEALLESARGPWLVLRLPLALGPGHRGATLGRYLCERIVREEPFEVWQGSTRYPIDVEDVVRIGRRLIDDPACRNRRINVALRPYAVTDFVHALERITGKQARYTVVPKGSHYEIRCPEAGRVAAELGVRADEGYLERVLRRYFTPQESG